MSGLAKLVGRYRTAGHLINRQIMWELSSQQAQTQFCIIYTRIYSINEQKIHNKWI